jgi:hypothetical protein
MNTRCGKFVSYRPRTAQLTALRRADLMSWRGTARALSAQQVVNRTFGGLAEAQAVGLRQMLHGQMLVAAGIIQIYVGTGLRITQGNTRSSGRVHIPNLLYRPGSAATLVGNRNLMENTGTAVGKSDIGEEISARNSWKHREPANLSPRYRQCIALRQKTLSEMRDIVQSCLAQPASTCGPMIIRKTQPLQRQA